MLARSGGKYFVVHMGLEGKVTMSSKMPTHRFVLILSEVSELEEKLEGALFEAGCDDATLCTRDGVVSLDFDRQAVTFLDAVLSAIRDVTRAGLQVARVEPDDLVTEAEVARRMKRTRQSVHQIVTGQRGSGGFPQPVAGISSRSPLWRWMDVVEWFRDKKGLARKAAETAAAVAAINDLLDLRRHKLDTKAREKILRQLGPTIELQASGRPSRRRQMAR